MSEAELLEQIAAYMGNCISAFTMYVSLTFGYLTVAYLVARRLTSFQAIASTSMYVGASLSCVFTLIAALSVMDGISKELAETSTIWPNTVFTNVAIWIPAMAVIMTAGVVTSVYFFHTVRKSEEKV
jgi:hypothetical protein